MHDTMMRLFYEGFGFDAAVKFYETMYAAKITDRQKKNIKAKIEKFTGEIWE